MPTEHRKIYYYVKIIEEIEIFLHDQSLCQISRVTKKLLSDEIIAAIQDWPTQNPDHNRRNSVSPNKTLLGFLGNV